MRANEFIVETHGGVWRLIRNMAPRHWPDYVVKDWFYAQMSREAPENIKLYIQQALKDYPVRQWKLENLELGYHSFDSKTQEKLLQRISQTDNLISQYVPRDSERHEIQRNIIQKTGQANQEPIIVIYHKDGYELLEGWHRTIQNIHSFPNGYKARAWVGYL